MANDYEIFDGKSLSDLFKDIYDNTARNKEQLEVLMKEVVGFSKDGDTAVQIIPMLKEDLDINVKNEATHLANMLQKANIITVLNKLGIKATLDKDGNLKLPDEPQVTVTDDKPEVGALKP